MKTFSLWQKLNPIWALFGNADDGIYGDDAWRAGRPCTPWLAVQWWFRNPFHNLFCYVIGVSNKPFTFTWTKGAGMEDAGVIRGYVMYGRWRLPFIGYRSSRFVAYAGWRPSGAFGFKAHPIKAKPKG